MEQEFIMSWLSLPGAAAFIAMLINTLKYTPLLKDGDSGKWSVGLNILGMAGLLALQVFQPEASIGSIDGVAAQLAEVGIILTGLLVQLMSSEFFSRRIKGFPIIGKSMSGSK